MGYVVVEFLKCVLEHLKPILHPAEGKLLLNVRTVSSVYAENCAVVVPVSSSYQSGSNKNLGLLVQYLLGLILNYPGKSASATIPLVIIPRPEMFPWLPLPTHAMEGCVSEAGPRLAGTHHQEAVGPLGTAEEAYEHPAQLLPPQADVQEGEGI